MLRRTEFLNLDAFALELAGDWERSGLAQSPRLSVEYQFYVPLFKWLEWHAPMAESSASTLDRPNVSS